MLKPVNGPLPDLIIGCSGCRKILSYQEVDRQLEYVYCPICGYRIPMQVKKFIEESEEESHE